MGVDCTMVIERYLYTISTTGNEYWETIGVCVLPRNYDMFEEIRDIAEPGYPMCMNYMTEKIMDEFESWGECYMDYESWVDLSLKYDFRDYAYIRKAKRYSLRCIFRFDN